MFITSVSANLCAGCHVIRRYGKTVIAHTTHSRCTRKRGL